MLVMIYMCVYVYVKITEYLGLWHCDKMNSRVWLKEVYHLSYIFHRQVETLRKSNARLGEDRIVELGEQIWFVQKRTHPHPHSLTILSLTK